MTLPALYRRLPSFPIILALSTTLRIALILYSEWHDARSVVKYTDVDYRVFTDAARFLLHPGPGDVNHARGPLSRLVSSLITFNIGDPYTRETYRYTPLLALLLTPNIWLHPSFGKYLFAGCDIVNGVLIYVLLVSDILPGLSRTTQKSSSTDGTQLETSEAVSREKELKAEATLYATIHLLNPMVFSISTRGSSESVLSLLVLYTLFLALRQRWDAAAIMLGLSTHWKIYPVIYGVACLGVINNTSASTGRRKGLRGWVESLVSLKSVRFAVLSAGTFGLLSAGCYLVWGYPFLYESYLYHIHRLDHRHNFSPYFYLTYLTYPSLTSPVQHALPLWSRIARSPLCSFVPQMSLAFGTGFAFGRRKQDLVFAWFVQTVVFVLFNKVCTSQYFLWYLLFLPLLMPRLSTSRRRALTYLGVWVGTQALWLSEAYKLEFLGQNVFFGLWVRSLIYVLGNAWILMGIMGDYVA